MRVSINRFNLLFAFILSGPGLVLGETEFYNGHEVVAKEVLVKFKSGFITSNTIQSAKVEEDIVEEKDLGSIGVKKFRSRSSDVATLIRNLKRRSDVEFVEPNYLVYATAVPNDLNANLWALQNTGQPIAAFDRTLVSGTPGADIGAVAAWDISTGSRSMVVGVIDTGIDYRHPDLAANIWSAPSAFSVTIGGVRINCAAGTHGFNAITNSCDPADDQGHGTHVAGTIGAVGNNNAGLTGVNQVASMMGLKFLSASGSGTTQDAIEAIEFAIQAKAVFGTNADVRVFNASWGCLSCFSQSLLNQILKANANGIMFVAAAGNDNNNNDLIASYPANYGASNVISVAATNNIDSRSSFSNFGANSVHLGAPGEGILSTLPNNRYGFAHGTSMATPHVSGAAALVLSQCDLTTTQLKAVLLSSVDNIAALAGITITGGRLNVDKAIRSCAPSPVVELTATPTSLDPPMTSTLTWTSSNTTDCTASGGWVGPKSTAGSETVAPEVTTTYTLTCTGANGTASDAAVVTVPAAMNVDLVLTSLTTNTTTINIGASLEVGSTVLNQGTVMMSAASGVVTVYLSPDSIITTDDRSIGSWSYGQLNGGASQTSNNALSVPTDLEPGTYFLGAIVDSGDEQPETDETNNVRLGSTITVVRRVDLVMTAISTNSTTVNTGGQLTVSSTVRNQGSTTMSAPGGWVTVYLSTNRTISTADTPIGSWWYGALPAGGNQSNISTFVVPTNLRGRYYLGAIADSSRMQPEINEANNARAGTLLTIR